jgi:SAM-dependent methyltransferase
MLHVLARSHPAADARTAGADELPLPDRSVDAVLVAQAWHWFPHERAVAEVCRVLRPGGRLGLVWNQASPEEPWQVAVERLNAGARGQTVDTARELPDVVEVDGLPSAELEAALFPWHEQLRPEDVRARLATYSHIALLPTAPREELLDEVVTVVRREAARLGTATVPFRQTAYCVRWRPS